MIWTLSPACRFIFRRESAESRASLESIRTTISDCVDMTRVREKSAWAEIGRTTRASTSGHTTGPPAENAYAVEPVGVAQIKPSQPHLEIGRPSISKNSSTIVACSLSTVTSLSAHPFAISCPSRITEYFKVMRGSITYFFSAIVETIVVSVAFSTSAKKPTWPRFTPSNGICCVRVTSAALNMVPSPPRTTPTSNSGKSSIVELVIPAIDISEIV